jgi:hypothetical protein
MLGRDQMDAPRAVLIYLASVSEVTGSWTALYCVYLELVKERQELPLV